MAEIANPPVQIGRLLTALGTITADTKVIESTVTLNNAAVTFTAWKLNVTDTASAAASLLADLQTGGVSQFKVSKAGVCTASTSFVATTLTGTLSTAAQPNVTSVGALTGFTVSNSITNVVGDLDINALTGGANAVRINRSGGTGGFIVLAGGTLTENFKVTDAGVGTIRAGLTATTGNLVTSAGTLSVSHTDDVNTASFNPSHATYTGAAIRISATRAASATYSMIRATANGVNQFVVSGAGDITAAGACTIGGALSGVTTLTTALGSAWDFGAAAVVSPTSPNRTLRVKIGGTDYYIAAKLTND